MKKTKIFSLLAAALTFGFVACNNDSSTTATTDDTTNVTDGTATTGTTTTTNTQDYAALADSFRVNSEAGNYLNPRTGKPMRIKYDTERRAVYDETTGEPVWRYVDRRNWWVYGGDNWDTIGRARMQNNRLMYGGDNDTWVTYEQRWRDEDTRLKEDWKRKFGDTKIKVGKDGDVKVKDESGKVKYDADDNKVKTDSSR
jgi:hypothetical protein